MKILAVIPARGGSKGIPHKNIVPLAGKPLLAYTVEAAMQAGILTDVAISTDDAEIMRVARDLGASDTARNTNATGLRVIHRPADISGDTASTESVLLHALSVMEQQTGESYDAVMCLQPTSPFRQPETIRAFAAQFEKDTDRYDALLTLHENRADHWVQHEDGHFGRLYPDAPRRRQERKPLFIENSCIYLTRVSALKETSSVLGCHINGFVISEEEGFDINEQLDLVIAEGIMHRKIQNKNRVIQKT